MIDPKLQRYTGRPTASASTDELEGDNVEDRGGYGLLRGVRDRALALELRKRDDTVLAIPYALIEQFLYTPADGITLRAAGREFRIVGRNLNADEAKRPTFFSALVRHRVPWVAERSRGSGPAVTGEDATVIDSLSW